MPIPKHLRQFYSAKAGWPKKRAAILARAGGKLDERGRYAGGAHCEDCQKPDRERVISLTWREDGQPRMAWRQPGIIPWWRVPGQDAPVSLVVQPNMKLREILVVVTVGHRNHASGDDRPSNLRAWCQWCHLNFDRAHHHESRARRKDARRPLLEVAS